MLRKYRPVLIVLLVLVSLPLIVKGLMHLRVQQIMDDLVARAADRFEISYAGIDTELAGAASVTGIRILPVGLEQPITIDRVRLASEDPWVFIRPAGWSDTGRQGIPDRLHLLAQSVRVPMRRDVQEAFRRGMPMQPSSSGDCDSFNLDPVQLKAMGYPELSLDFSMDYRLDRVAEQLDLEFDVDLHKIESFSLATRLTGLLPEDIQTGRLANAKFALADMRMRLEPAFGERFVAYCAKRQGLSTDAFEKRLIDNLGGNLKDSGIVVGDELLQALRDYYRQWGEIRLYVKPEQPLGMLQFLSLKPDQMAQALGISLFVNGRLIHDLDVRIDLAQAPGVAPGDETRTTRDAPAAPPAQTRTVREFRPVAPGSLVRHIGSLVRIHPQDQPVRQGVLERVANGVADVRQHTLGGTVTSHVPLDTIRSVEVEWLRRVPAD